MPCYESPVAAMMRHEAFVQNARVFLVEFLGRDLPRPSLERAVDRIAPYDIVSPLGVTPHEFCTLGRKRMGLQLAGMFAPPHAFVVEVEVARMIMDARGVFAILSFQVEADNERNVQQGAERDK